MNRRGFLGAILAGCAAPAIVRADSLMRVIPTETKLLTGELSALGGVRFYESDLALSLDEFSRRYIEPAVQRLVCGIEADFVAGLAGLMPPPQTIKIRMPNQYTRASAGNFSSGSLWKSAA